MKKFTVLCAVVLMVLVLLAPTGCQQSTPDVVEVIAIFPAESGAPPPTSAWAFGRGIDPHPDRIQRVFNLGDRMFLGFKISNLLETDITFSRYTFFNKETAKEVEVGLPGDLGPFEPGQATLSAFQNPWDVPTEPGNYELRVYLDNTVAASAVFEVSARVPREAVVLVKAQLKAGGYDRISGFIISTDGRILTFHPGASEITHWEVVLGDERSFEASIFKTHQVWGFTCLKIEAPGLTPLQLADYHELQPPANEAGNYELYPYTMREGLVLFAATYKMGQQMETEVEVLDPYLRLPLNPARYPERTFPVVKLDTGGKPVMTGVPVVNSPGQVMGQVVAFDQETGEGFMVTIDLIKAMLFESYTSGTVIREYPREVVEAVFEEIQSGIREILREREQRVLMDVPMQMGYGRESIFLLFAGEADSEIVEMAKAVVDSKAPGLRLTVKENVTLTPPTPLPPIPQNGD